MLDSKIINKILLIKYPFKGRLFKAPTVAHTVFQCEYT